jgi:hypothetical protein
VLVSCISQLDIKGASISCRERGYVRIVTKQLDLIATGSPLNKLDVEI